MEKTNSVKMNFGAWFIVFPLIIGIGCIGCNVSGGYTDNLSKNGKAVIQPAYLQKFEELTVNQDIKKGLAYIEDTDSQTIDDQVLLTEIPAPPFEEKERGQKFSALLEKYGADSVWTDEARNVIGLHKGTQRDSVLAIAGHLDTVFPPGTDVHVQQRGDTLFAPGISDDGRGIATVLTLLRTIVETEIAHKSDILFIGNVGEEGLGDLRGMKHLFGKGGPQIDYFISIDGSSTTSVTNGALGSHRYKATFKGPGRHSWGAFGLANPLHTLARALTYFVDRAEVYTKSGPKTSYNIGRTGGGTSVNSIPFESWFEVDMRSLSPERLNEIDTLFHQAIRQGLREQNELRRDGPAVTVDLEMIGNRPSGYTSVDQPIVQWTLAATKWTGQEPKLRVSSTDSNIPISKGIPAVTIGGGGKAKVLIL